MRIYKSILVVHPGAIGDAVMGTPVPIVLRKNFPDARIVYLTHASLFPLLELCGAINVFLEWDRHTPLLQIARTASEHSPELVVDLVGSLKTRLLSLALRRSTLTYRKQRNRQRWQHVVDNYLATLKPLKLPTGLTQAPVLAPPRALLEELEQDEELGQRLIALVPGVGKHRPNRAWPVAHWVQLGELLHERYRRRLVLVGGADDEAVCRQVASALGHKSINVAGQMSLTQTAALLSRCEFVVSADTGPAHIAAAVGRKVVCLMGPTAPERTGPYAMADIGISRLGQCRCLQAKHCLQNDGTGPGECMKTITVEEAFAQVRSVLPPSAPDVVEACRPG